MFQLEVRLHFIDSIWNIGVYAQFPDIFDEFRVDLKIVFQYDAQLVIFKMFFFSTNKLW